MVGAGTGLLILLAPALFLASTGRQKTAGGLVFCDILLRERI